METNTNPNKNQGALLIRPHPFRNEGPKGYMLRLAEANWMSIKALQQIGIIYDYQYLKHEMLLPPIEIDPELHRQVAYNAGLMFKKYRVWNQRNARFCPLCLKDDVFWRNEWELLFHDACSLHGVWLIDQCSSCGNQLSWDRASVVRCQCGADLRAELPNPCPHSVVKLSYILKSKINKVNQQMVYDAPFKSTDIEQTQRIIRYLGTYMNEFAGKNPLKIKQAGSMVQSWPITSLASAIVSQWPQAYHTCLTTIQNKQDDGDKPTLQTVFGRSYHYLYRCLTEAAFEEIKVSFETWLSEHWKGGLARRNKRIGEFILDKASWIPANLACETLGIAHQRLKLLIREGVIEGETYFSDKDRKFTMVRRDNFEAVKHSLTGEIDMKTAGALLGVCKKRMRMILRSLFPEAKKTGPHSTSAWVVPRHEVNKLLLLAQDLPRVSIADEGCVSLSHIFRYSPWYAKDLAALIHAVQQKDIELINVQDGVAGIGAWIFEESKLNAWYAKNTQGYGTWLTADEAAKLIGIKQQVAYEMIHMRFIKSELMHGQAKGGTRIRRTEVETFKANYIFATEVSHVLGVSPRKAFSILDKQFIKPISGPTIDGARQVLYSRTNAIMQLLSEAENSESTTLKLT